VVGHVGAWLLADLAEATGLERGFSDALGSMRQRGSGHDPGRVAVDLAVMLADGGEAICDLAVLRDQPGLFGSVASDPTAWRVLAGIDDEALARLRTARAAARELAWAQAAETRGGLPGSTAAGQPVPGLVLDLDASIVVCHSEKEQAAATCNRASATTRCSASSPPPARPSPECCARATPGRTPPPTTSPSSTTPWPRSRTRGGTAPRS
jgi:hypothetical protein